MRLIAEPYVKYRAARTLILELVARRARKQKPPVVFAS